MLEMSWQQRQYVGNRRSVVDDQQDAPLLSGQRREHGPEQPAAVILVLWDTGSVNAQNTQQPENRLAWRYSPVRIVTVQIHEQDTTGKPSRRDGMMSRPQRQSRLSDSSQAADRHHGAAGVCGTEHVDQRAEFIR